MKIKLLIVLLLVIASRTATAQVYGTAFGDYFYKVSGDSTGGVTEYAPYAKDFNSFEFRRIYLGYKHTISDNFLADFQLSYEGKDFTSATNRTVFVKTAELQWKGIFTNADLIVGLTSTPGFSYVTEKVWGYRAVEKTIMDQRGILSSRDLGVVLRGTFDKDKNYGYSFMIGNGRGGRLENNKYKKFYGQLFSYLANKKLVVEAYSDYEDVSSERSRTTLKGFAAYQTEKVTAGVEVFTQNQKNFIGDTANSTSFGISAFVTGNIIKGKLNFFARYDYFDPDNNNTTSGFKESFITAGLDITPKENIHIMPNIWVNTYKDKSISNIERDADIVPRVTFWYVY